MKLIVKRVMAGETDYILFEEEFEIPEEGKELTITMTKNIPASNGEKIIVEVDEDIYADVELQLVKEKIH